MRVKILRFVTVVGFGGSVGGSFSAAAHGQYAWSLFWLALAAINAHTWYMVRKQ